MNRKEIIRMAREVGLLPDNSHPAPQTRHLVEKQQRIERFAALIAAAEREKLKYDGIHTCHDQCDRPFCMALREAVAAEREACAKVVVDLFGGESTMASAIRTRGEK